MDDKSLPYGMAYAEFVKLHCFHKWASVPYRPEERVPFFGNRDKWQCEHCQRIVWNEGQPPPDLQLMPLPPMKRLPDE